MGLKRLTIKNIGSIASKTINFEAAPLDSASLFLITGPTGSGKSIILDCICLALYGKAARLEKIKSQDKYIDPEFNCSQDGNISLSDARQLVRRGTTEAMSELVFVGRDGVEYTASWSVSRGERAKLTQRLSADKRRISSADGSVSFTKVSEVDQFIQSPGVIGMKFEEFCRTCLLAQGEFTKFLDSKTDEKANILEKVTGTEKFSIIGKRINEKYRNIMSHAQGLIDEINDPMKAPMAEEDRKAIEAERETQEKEKENLTKQKATLAQKKSIIDRRQAIVEKERQAKELLDAAMAAEASEAYTTAVRDTTDWKTSADARAELKKKDTAENDRKRASATMTSYQGALAGLCGGLEWLKDSLKVYDSLEDEIKNVQNELSGKEAQKDALNSEALAAEGKRLTLEKGNLEAIFRQAAIWKSSRKNNLDETFTDSLDEQQKKLYCTVRDKALLLWETEDKAQEAKNTYDDVFRRFQNHAEAVRSTLKEGDTCPVCGNIITSILTSDKIDEILLPLKQEIDSCQNGVNAANGEYDKAVSEISAAVNKAAAAINEWQTRNGRLTETATAIAGLTRRLGELEKKLSLKATTLATIVRIEAVKADVISRLKVNAPTNILKKEDKSLEGNWSRLKDSITATQVLLDTAGKSIQEADKSIETFLKENPKFTAERLVELSGFSQKDIDSLDARIQKVKQDIVAAKALITSCENERKAITEEIKTKGVHFEEEESSESLGNAIVALEQSISEIDGRCGEIRNIISSDDERITAIAETRKAYEAIREELTNYETLNSLFGQSDGALFKRIAQSHLLGVLLGNANYYMSQFNDRYELTRQEGSLVVLISDKDQDGIPRPVNTLSGGESFMASLALALGLSSLSSNDTTMDTIFIDEGFGTLSPNCLTNVYATLSSLKKVVGKKVGIISHVEELKEQIHPQIVVEPVGNGLSIVHDPA